MENLKKMVSYGTRNWQDRNTVLLELRHGYIGNGMDNRNRK
jgi:hypothetical protein